MIEIVSTIRVANAPCSWGALEFEGLQGEEVPYSRMLDELRDTGYTGSELGDWGYMPTEAAALRAELERRRLALVGAFVPVALRREDAHAAGEAQALKVAHLLVEAATGAAQGDQLPFLILADDNGADPLRTRHAGRVMPQMGLSQAEWRTFAGGAERIARSVREQTGLKTAFHHHCAGYVETPEEIARLLDMTDPELLGLVFDTGHYLFGSGRVDGAVVLEGFERFGERVWHVHFKDLQPQVAAQSRAEEWDYFTSLGHGLFCELGQGSVPFSAFAGQLRARSYRGWVVVEQDILPGMGSPAASSQRNRDFLKTIGL
ncbi:MAG TPA: TIM barrel protein [Ktedonobacteraceae bacterium]|nr:TIM barrel protein [Ktedonobacteraceae bacterium]